MTLRPSSRNTTQTKRTNRSKLQETTTVEDSSLFMMCLIGLRFLYHGSSIGIQNELKLMEKLV